MNFVERSLVAGLDSKVHAAAAAAAVFKFAPGGVSIFEDFEVSRPALLSTAAWSVFTHLTKHCAAGIRVGGCAISGDTHSVASCLSEPR